MELPIKNYCINHRSFSLEVANYGTANGPICLQVWGDEGPEARLTINLPDFRLSKGEIFTKQSEITWNRPHLQAIGFENTGRVVNYGHFDAMAEVWKIKQK
jgi:hypothetical protein